MATVDTAMAPHRASMPAYAPTATPPWPQDPQGSAAAAAAAASAAPMPQKRIHREVRFGNYILGSTLGEGEFGKVKLGWRKDGKQPSQVAMKLIKRDSILKDSDSEIKVHREINSLKLLNHPNIVNLVEVMKLGKYIGIVLEYASGGELFDYILHHKHLKENVAKKLFAQLVSGVDYMHCKGLVHRDLKLENLLLDKHKNVIISDFGFVNSFNREKLDLMKTSCGLPCYAAPELVLTQLPYEGRKVDIWSLGVILYAMLAGYLPFDDDPENEDGADIVRLYHYICRLPLTFPEYVSPLARDLLRKIIVPDPKRRILMAEIRAHPWLTPHVSLLSIRQVEWDRIHRENRQVPQFSSTLQQTANKRYSMLNERTNSSALMPKRGRSNSGASLNAAQPAVPTTSSSLANAVALPTLTSSASLVHEDPLSATSLAANSPTRYQRGLPHYVPPVTPASPVAYPGFASAASTALKAVVNENNFKRNSMSSITTPSGVAIPATLSRSSTYTGGAISTIVESPTRATMEGADVKATAVASPLRPVPADYISLLPSRANYNPARLPHSEKRPRPTSYHPLSMTSTLSNANGLLDYMNLPVPLFMSTSPTKSTTSASGGISNSEPISSSNSIAEHPSTSPLSGVISGLSVHSRRNSVVTPIHVSGVLTSETQNLSHDNRNSVLHYLEDKIEALDLTELHSPTKERQLLITTPQINQLPVFDTQTPGAKLDKAPAEAAPEAATPAEAPTPVRPHVESLIPTMVQDFKSDRAKKEHRSSHVPCESDPARDKKERRRSHVPRESARDPARDKENKKRNRFSLLSFYSTYSSLSTTLDAAATPAAPKRKVLEPSLEANIAKSDKKRVPSGGLARLGSSKTSTATAATSASASTAGSLAGAAPGTGKEASAARKVMDFFKRRSVRMS